MYYPDQRQSKDATLSATFATDGTKFETIIIIQKTIFEKELYSKGHRSNCSYHFGAEIWDCWADTMISPECNRRRKNCHYQEPILWLINVCSTHFSEYFRMKVHITMYLFLWNYQNHLINYNFFFECIFYPKSISTFGFIHWISCELKFFFFLIWKRKYYKYE